MVSTIVISKPLAFIRKGTQYDPHNRKSDNHGFIDLWFGLDSKGAALTCNYRKEDCEKQLRAFGYFVANAERRYA